MSFITNVAAKLSSTEKSPVIRKRGLRSSSKRLTLHFPSHADGRAIVIPLGQHACLEFTIVESAKGHAINYRSFTRSLRSGEQQPSQEESLQQTELATFATRDEASAVISKIVSEISPSYWKVGSRLLAIWFVFFLFMPSSKPDPAAGRQALMSEMQQMQQARQMQPQQQMYVAPQMQSAPAPAVAPSAPQGVASGDPFGLQLDPSGK